MKFTLLTAALLAATIQPALASEFRVDILVFLNQATPNGSPDEASAVITRYENKGIAFGASDRLQAAGIRALPYEDFGLDQAWGRLRNAQAFVPYLRASWTQPGIPRQRAKPVRLNDGVTVEIIPTPTRRYVSEIYSEAEATDSAPADAAGDNPLVINQTATDTPPARDLLDNGASTALNEAPGDWGLIQAPPIGIDQLDGTVSLYAQRYLHLHVDLWWVQQQSGAAVVAGQQLAEADARVFHIEEQRRVRLNELHYFDHPRFGVLARVTRIGQ
ncbi:MAG: CsiV family protein [Pseudomonadota bacterium]|nr:CsiV family protein [Pseudomonadota bacterium]